MTGLMMDRLLPIALVGTERSPGLRALLREAPAPLNGLMLALAASPEEDASVLLRVAGVLAVAERVGRGVASVASLPEASAPARPDARPALSTESHVGLLQRLLDDAVPDGLRHEALSLVAQRGWRLPATLLPPMLALALRVPMLRPAVGAVMGERGRWLVRQQPRWRSIVERPAEPTEDDWMHGSGAARLAFLQNERRRDPAAARDRLMAELPSLAARERAELVEALAVGLSLVDEPLLVKLLRDRGGEVRALAATLLVRLPDSEQSAWLAGQWSALLRVESAWLGLKKRWHVEPPAAEDPAWKTRGLDPQRPRHDTLGERGWWLYQLARLTAPAFWTAHLSLAPSELIDWARGTDWKDALLRGWREAVLAAAGSAGVVGEPDAQPGAVEGRWLLALLACRDAKDWPAHELATLRSHLPLAARTALWRDRLNGDPVEVAAEVVQTCAQPLIDGSPERATPLDPALAVALTAAMVRDLSALFSTQTLDERRTAAWLDAAPALVGWLPPACLDAIESLPAPTPPAETHAHLNTWLHARIATLHDRLQQAVALRRAFHALPVAAVSSSTGSTDSR